MKKSLFVLSALLLAVGATVGGASELGVDVDGGEPASRVCLRGEDGLWWNINRYEDILKALALEDGTIPEEHVEKARFVSRRLARLYEIAGQFDSTVSAKSQTGDCIANESGDCGVYDYSYISCADAEYDPPYVNCSQGGAKALYGKSMTGRSPEAAGYHVQAWSAIDIDECVSGWWSVGYVYAYMDVDGDECEDDATDYANFNDPEYYVTAACSNGAEPDCRYALSEVTVYYGLSAVDYYYCEDDYPSSCY